MLVLAADTSTPYLSVAICDGPEVLVDTSILADRKHSEKLLSYVDIALKECAIDLHEIDLIAVAHGPGSFTGVRIGVSACKGLAAGADIPVVGVSTLEALARRLQQHERPVCAVLDAKMGEVYAAVYQHQNCIRSILHPSAVAPIEDILLQCPDDTLFLGDGAILNQSTIAAQKPNAQIMPAAYQFPGAIAVAQEAIALFETGNQPPSATVSPVYLRKSQAEVNRDNAAAEALSK